jgi:hypothetical protein
MSGLNTGRNPSLMRISTARFVACRKIIRTHLCVAALRGSSLFVWKPLVAQSNCGGSIILISAKVLCAHVTQAACCRLSQNHQIYVCVDWQPDVWDFATRVDRFLCRTKVIKLSSYQVHHKIVAIICTLTAARCRIIETLPLPFPLAQN